MIRNIVLATDLGPFASHALEHAMDMAAIHRAKVYVVHAVEPLSSFAHAMVSTYVEESSASEDSSPEELLSSIRRQIADRLSQERSEVDPSYDCFEEFAVVQGRPAEVILAEAKRIGADLIVLGSHGPESMGNNVLGSVTSRVLQLSKVPVYMVPMISPRNWYKLSSESGFGMAG